MTLPALPTASPSLADFELLVRDDTRAIVGELDDYRSLELVGKFRAVGSWQLELDGAGSTAALVGGWGRGIVVRRRATSGRPAVVLFSGEVSGLTRKRGAGQNVLTVRGVCDNAWLGDRLCYPEAPAVTTATTEFDVRTGLASTIMRQYVDNNAGPSAASQRRVYGLTIGDDPYVGSSVNGRARFEVLLDLLATLAAAGGDLGFHVRQSATSDALVFDVYSPRDLTALAEFSFELGNLREYEYGAEAPDGNAVLVGGSGDGIARTFALVEDTDSQSRFRRRVEQLDDYSSSAVAAELLQRGTAALLERAARTGVTLSPVDTAQLAYGRDYRLGDTVTVVCDDETIADVVREVRLKFTRDGVEVTPNVGSSDNRADPRVPRFFDRLRKVQRQARTASGRVR